MSETTAASDPTLRPAYSLRNRIMRGLWGVVYATLYWLSPRPMLAWRAMLLRLFGAQLGAQCHFHRTARIWAPWNLYCADRVCVADGAELYNPSPLYMGSHCIVSQGRTFAARRTNTTIPNSVSCIFRCGSARIRGCVRALRSTPA